MKPSKSSRAGVLLAALAIESTDVAGFMIGSALAFVSGLHSISIPRNLDRYRKAQ